jgi:uncharacterized protein YegP (UPF0339 family)
MAYELKKSKNGKFMFNLKAGNNQVILTSEMYEAKASAKSGIASVRKNGAKDGNFELKTSASGKAYFVLRASNKEIIGKSEMYESVAGAKRGIASVKRNCGSDAVKEVEAGTARKRPLSVVSCALTNEPNIKGGKPVANRQSPVVGGERGVSHEGAKGTQGNLSRDYRIDGIGGERREGTRNAEEGKGAAERGVSHEGMKGAEGNLSQDDRIGGIGGERREGTRNAEGGKGGETLNAQRSTLNAQGGKRGMGNRWSDAARAVSLAVRQAKAAARKRALVHEGVSALVGGTGEVSRGDAPRQARGRPGMERVPRKGSLRLAARLAVAEDKARARAAKRGKAEEV